MRRLTKYEKETVLNSNELEDFWIMYTYNSALKRKLRTFAEKYPDYCRQITSTEDGSVTYRVAKDRVFINFRGPISEETRKVRRVTAERNGFGPIGGKNT